MIYAFGDIELDLNRHMLLHAGKPVPVEPQVFDVLRVLAENAGSLVSKDRLIDEVWGRRIVSDATVSARINAARTAVGDNGKDQRVIRTVHRRGFELTATVSIEDAGTLPPPAELRQTIRYATSHDGTSIAWSSAGDGPPMLYAWHHLCHLEKDWNSRLLRPTLNALAHNHRLIRFDNRGAGLSGPLKPADSLDDHVGDMLAVADAAGLETFPVFATLQSAAVAIRLAARHPDRVSRLVIHNGYARGRATRENAPEESDSDPFIALLRSGGWGDPENGFMRAWATIVLPMASFDETTDVINLIAHASSTDDALLQRKLIDNLNVVDDLGKVRAPTLVIHAQLCAIHPVSEGRRLAAGIPGAEFIEVDSSNTFLIASDPSFQRVLSAATEFLDHT